MNLNIEMRQALRYSVDSQWLSLCVSKFSVFTFVPVNLIDLIAHTGPRMKFIANFLFPILPLAFYPRNCLGSLKSIERLHFAAGDRNACALCSAVYFLILSITFDTE